MGAVELHSKRFYGTGLIFSIDQNSLKASVEINSKITTDSEIISLIPKKVELLIRFFEPFWISRVFHFSSGALEEVEAHPDPLGTSDETYAQSKFDISGSNETMQNALASIV